MSAKRIYFASDFHLGAPDAVSSDARERKVVAWLDSIAEDADRLFLLGDVWDFWFEYTTVVPKGSIRLLGALQRLRDRGIPIDFFGGNHDFWTYGYLREELGITVHKKPITLELQGTTCLIGHGDGLGPGEYDYKLMKFALNSRIFRWVFHFIHPDIGLQIAQYFSRRSRKKNMKKDAQFLGEKEFLWQYTQKHHLDSPQIRYYIFGHRHLPLNLEVGENARYINTGDWLKTPSYAYMENGEITLCAQ